MQHEYPHPFVWVPEDEYHAAARRGQYVTSHMLADFRRSPLLYKRTIDGIIPPVRSEAFAFGTAAHKLILEGTDAFNAAYLVAEGPVNPKTGEAFGPNTKAYREWATAQAPRIVLSPRDWAKLTNMNLAVTNHKDAQRLLSGGFPEATVRTERMNGTLCQARIDWFNPAEGIVDLKTCEDLDRFEYDAKKFGYGYQSAFYRTSVSHATDAAPEDIPCYIIAVEKSEPFRCGVWQVDSLWLDDCTRTNSLAIQRLAQCKESGVWPSGFESMRILSDLH